MATVSSNPSGWPKLRYSEWAETCSTLHRMAQVVGKIRLAATPWINHSWHATFYVTARGLTTSPIFVRGQTLQIEFDLIEQFLEVRTNRPALSRMPLQATSIARFRAR